MKTLSALLLSLLLGAGAWAQTAESRTVPAGGAELNRMKKPSALTFAINKPAPMTFGLNYAYTFSPLMKAELGSGSTLGASAMGAGATLMYPEWNFTPTLGVHLSYIQLETSILSVNGVTKSGALVYASLGFEYQSEGGFNVGAGMNIPTGGMDSTSYVSLGWAFDWLKM